MKINRVCVFLGSSPGKSDIYQQAAAELGTYIARQHWDLVYGGSKIGLMGVLAKAALDHGAKVYGVIPKSIHDKLDHYPQTKTHVVKDMHERKMTMQKMSDCFIAMPGGLGTLEEIFESLTWLQLGFHHKPCAFYNINGYFDKLLAFLDDSVSHGFIKPTHRQNVITENNPEDLFKKIIDFKAPQDEKWL